MSKKAKINIERQAWIEETIQRIRQRCEADPRPIHPGTPAPSSGIPQSSWDRHMANATDAAQGVKR